MKFAIAILPHTYPLTREQSDIDIVRHWLMKDSHLAILERLQSEFDGFAVSIRCPDGQPEHADVWQQYEIVRWERLHPPIQFGEKARRVTEAVVLSSSRAKSYNPPPLVRSKEAAQRGVRKKSISWYSWVIAHLGAIPGEDTVVDFFTLDDVTEFCSMLALEEVAI